MFAALTGCRRSVPASAATASQSGASPAGATRALHPLRLDANAVPVAESLYLDIDPDSARYSGTADITLEINAPTDSLRVHADGLILRNARLDRGDRRIALDAAARPAGLTCLRGKEPFLAGRYGLHIEFGQAFNTRSTSLYKVKVQGRSYVFSQFEAWDARKAFPCFDEPAFKIPWSVTVRIPAWATAVGNYPAARTSAAGASRTIAFRRTDPMPSYLVEIAVGAFDSVAIPGLSVPGRIYTVKGQSRLAGQAAAMAGPLLAALEGYFGARCPYPKLDLLAVPEFMAGAMENPGAITFRENLLLLDPGEATAARRSWLASVTAHEMSHLWFGDLVTMKWWNDLWLNESFASWMGDKTVDKVYPEFRLAVESVSGRQWAMMLDAMPTARAIRTQVLPTDNPSQSFDGLAYDKGQEALGMLEAWMGEETFRKGIRDYLAAGAWKNAEAGDLWASLARAGGKPVDSMMAGFLDQAGVPLVNVEARDGILHLDQKRFLLSADAKDDGRIWKIPMVFRCLSQGHEYRARYLLETREADFRPEGFAPSLCHPDADERGYYRWNLPPAAMDTLSDPAAGFLTERERRALVGDLDALAKAGIMGTDALLGRLKPISADTSPQVIQALLEVLQGVDADLIDSASEAGYAAYVRDALGPVLDRIGWKARPHEGGLVPDLRARAFSMLARQGQDEKAGKMAEALAELYLKDPGRVDPSLVRPALTIAAGRGGLELFRAYRRAFEQAATPVSRELLLGGLAGFRNPPAADSALEYALRGPMRPHEIMTIPKGISSWRERKEGTLAWLLGNLEPILQRRSLEDAAYLPWFAANEGPEAWARTKAAFMKLDGRVPGIAKELEKVEAEADRKEELRIRDRDKVRAYLRRFSS